MTPHPPQFIGSTLGVTHASPHAIRPNEQSQAPETHAVETGHATPHPPQLAGSELTSTHAPPQRALPSAQASSVVAPSVLASWPASPPASPGAASIPPPPPSPASIAPSSGAGGEEQSQPPTAMKRKKTESRVSIRQRAASPAPYGIRGLVAGPSSGGVRSAFRCVRRRTHARTLWAQIAARIVGVVSRSATVPRLGCTSGCIPSADGVPRAYVFSMRRVTSPMQPRCGTDPEARKPVRS